jgi:hypothetical protein
MILNLASAGRENDTMFTFGTAWLPLAQCIYENRGNEGGKVCFTRSAEEAAYWASLPQIDGDGWASILIFDRQLLRRRYKIQPYHDPIWDDETRYLDEAEEEVWAEVIVGKYLIGLVSKEGSQSERPEPLVKASNANWRRQIEMRLNELLYHVPDWRCRPEASRGTRRESPCVTSGQRGMGERPTIHPLRVRDYEFYCPLGVRPDPNVSQSDSIIQSMSALPPKADIGTQPRNVRFVPIADSCTAAKKSPAGLSFGCIRPPQACDWGSLSF